MNRGKPVKMKFKSLDEAKAFVAKMKKDGYKIDKIVPVGNAPKYDHKK